MNNQFMSIFYGHPQLKSSLLDTGSLCDISIGSVSYECRITIGKTKFNVF